jgi:AcrR family transcriptional regulator
MPKIAATERDAFYEARRTEVADVALRLWAENGFDQTSVARIAEEAGIAKGTLYLYFESKDALLLEVLRRNSLVPNIRALIEDLQSTTLEQAVHGFVKGAWRHLVEHRDLVLVVLRELPTHLDQARAHIERLIVPGNALLARYLDARIPPDRAASISSIISVRALVGMVIFVFLTQEILGAGRLLPVPEEQITTTIAELFLRGVAPTDASEAVPA